MKKILFISFSMLIILLILFLFWLRKRTALIDEQTSISESSSSTSGDQILYYTCAMHPSVRISVSAYNKGQTKDPICGMDLIPVYAQEEKNVVKLSPQEISLAGIETFPIRMLPLFKEIRTVGVVAFDPQLRTAEEEYIQALIAYEKIAKSDFEDAKTRAKEILDAARLKLELLGLNRDWIKELEEKRRVHRSLILPDEYMWVYADIYEYELPWPKIGDKVEITSPAYPGFIIEGEVKSIEPIIEESTRTLKLKILAKNEEDILKPNMYVDIFLKSELGDALAIPRDAVLDTGKRKICFVDLGQGRYQLREVKIGPLAQAVIDGKKLEFYTLIAGVKEGENVVLKGNYLLDSQSQLGAAGTVYGGALEPGEAPKHSH